MSSQSHESDPRVLNRRTLERDHPRLASLLRPGMEVLDVGCGTGAITAGIARGTGPSGWVVGIDRDDSLLAIARREHSLPSLSFERQDVLWLDFESRFDIVTAARVLQWVGEPGQALIRMKRAAKPGGHIVVLDYNHSDNCWEPSPPAEFAAFYSGFLRWRDANQWSNRMGDCLPDLFRSAGIAEVGVYVDDETAERGTPEFRDEAAIWLRVIETLGPAIVSSGILSEENRAAAARAYERYLDTGLRRQTLSLRTVVGRS